MPVQSNPTPDTPSLTTPATNASRGGDILAPAFGITVATWITAYISRMPVVTAPGQVTVAAMLIVIFLGGLLTARYSPKGVRAALAAGALSGLLDILIIGSLIHDYMTAHGGGAEALVPSAALWIAGSVLTSALVAGLGGLLGHFLPSNRRNHIHWTQTLALILAAATLPLITAGGLVTAFRAGLAVPDWPQSYGYNMFLFPLSMMQKNEGNFYEHAHRLMGTLVGLTSLTTAIYITLASRSLGIFAILANTLAIALAAMCLRDGIQDPGMRTALSASVGVLVFIVIFTVNARRLLKKGLSGRVALLAWSIFVAVCIQGVLGGTRVTERSIPLAITHGVFAQIVFASMAALAATAGKNFLTLPRTPSKDASTDRLLTATLVASVILQLILGAILRHTNSLLLLHITMATFVILIALACTVRAWGLHSNHRPLLITGLCLLAVIALQITLGLIALVVRAPIGETPSTLGAFITTAHQANGALLLALSATLTTWTWRLLTPQSSPTPSPAPIPSPV